MIQRTTLECLRVRDRCTMIVHEKIGQYKTAQKFSNLACLVVMPKNAANIATELLELS